MTPATVSAAQLSPYRENSAHFHQHQEIGTGVYTVEADTPGQNTRLLRRPHLKKINPVFWTAICVLFSEVFSFQVCPD